MDRRKWTELGAWENRWNSFAVSVLSGSDVDCEGSDEDKFIAIQDALQDSEICDLLAKLEDKILMRAEEILREETVHISGKVPTVRIDEI